MNLLFFMFILNPATLIRTGTYQSKFLYPSSYWCDFINVSEFVKLWERELGTLNFESEPSVYIKYTVVDRDNAHHQTKKKSAGNCSLMTKDAIDFVFWVNFVHLYFYHFEFQVFQKYTFTIYFILSMPSRGT